MKENSLLVRLHRADLHPYSAVPTACTACRAHRKKGKEDINTNFYSYPVLGLLSLSPAM